MALPAHKTKIVATIGPASDSGERLARLIRAGMSIARLNFSHGEPEQHVEVAGRVRVEAQRLGRRVAIMADLPGPKIRIGTIAPEPVELRAGGTLTLTTDEVEGNAERVSVNWLRLPEAVRRGDRIFLNDGLILLIVERVEGGDVVCTVDAGGELWSRKGLVLPGIDLGMSAFTDRDRVCLEAALRGGVDVVSQSFVESADDIVAVRDAARALGKQPFVVAKIERAGALRRYDDILAATDGIMVARGDLGVELPLERIALTQKDLIRRANRAGKPVITATQMLESMVASRLPTRAEATDVANAVLDGTDALMLSAESAVGKYPVESVATLARIAAATEQEKPLARLGTAPLPGGLRSTPSAASISMVVERALESVPCAAVFVLTRGGGTARMISRHHPPVWIAALSPDPRVCQALELSFGVYPIDVEEEPADWRAFASDWLARHDVPGDIVMLVTGPSLKNPDANHRIEFIRVDPPRIAT